jgi:phosphomannomutase
MFDVQGITMKMSTSLKISVSGVRGVVGESLTPSLVAYFAASFGEYVGGGRVLVGRDTRPTGVMYENAVIAGLLSVGCQPVILGIVPTPTVQLSVLKLRANGGIVISASHNPEEWNALKFINSSGFFLNHNESDELLDIYNQPYTKYVQESEYRYVHTAENSFNIHKTKIFSQIDVELIKKAKIKVAVDCCNGAGAPYAKEFLEELGCEVSTVFTDIDRGFERTPEPVAKNLHELGKLVKKNKCDVGFAMDPDADRLAVFDSSGEALGEQYSLVLAVAHVLDKSKNHPNVVVNLATTKAVEDIVVKADAHIFYSKIGEINVTSEMVAKKAAIGGEGGSGGVIWPAVHPCRDSFTGMAVILEMMATRSESIEAIVKSMPKYFTVNKKISCPSSRASQKVIRELREKYILQKPNTIDGIRIDWEDSWVLVRPSNTEPVIRITAEAQTDKSAEALAAKFATEVEEIGRLSKDTDR